MCYLTRRTVLPGVFLAASLVMARSALAQGEASAPGGAATPSATTEEESEETSTTPTGEAAKGKPPPETVAAPRPPAEPSAAVVEDEFDAPTDHWEVFSNGRIGTFFSWSKGDGVPQSTIYDPTTGEPRYQVDSTNGGTGGSPQTQTPIGSVPSATGMPQVIYKNSIDSMRIRSGFTGNVLGVGVKRKIGGTKVTGYISVTSVIDSQSQKKYFQSSPDFREGYIKFEGRWGSVLLGRAATLFDRGAVETDFLYLHGYGLGFPGDLGSGGGFPTGGQIGFGVLANGYAAGLVYATPKLAGVQLSTGLYDPARLNGASFERTKYLRPEFELTVDEPLGSVGKVHGYFNGGYQPNYRNNDTDNDVAKLMGIGYGGRVEVGPVHVAAGGHRGRGLGFSYPGLPGAAIADNSGTLRETDGFFLMGQLSLGSFDVSGGYGKSVIHLTTVDLTAEANGYPKTSVISSQAAVSGGVVFHARDWLHFDIDVLHADSKWSLGERQQINFYNAGTTITW